MTDPDVPGARDAADDSITAIDGHQIPPPVERPSFQEELDFLAAAASDLPGPG